MYFRVKIAHKYKNILPKRKLHQKSTELSPGYVPNEVETCTNPNAYFKPTMDSNTKPFSLILPPPNITGTLHLGHALTVTIEDILVRWKRMQGVETVWIPGTDHAGIATQVVVEKALFKENGLSKHDIGRSAFEEKVWQWKHDKGGTISEQLRKLGVSLNWEKEKFTMDASHVNAVNTAFIRLFEKGLIYRSDSLVNWSCVLKSAISDIEVEHINISGPTDLNVPGYDSPVKFGTLVDFAYKIDNSDTEVVVSTTRPETIPGDVAIAVHPEDSRYANLIGQKAVHPFRNTLIPIISDTFVDPNFGTGAVKVTPAHDCNDFDLGKRHDLETIQVIDDTGKLTNNCGEFSKMPRFLARKAILDKLANLGLFRGQKDHDMIVPICSRSRDVVEFLTKPQWFLKCSTMAKMAADDVRNGRLVIEPKEFEKTWFNWLDNIKDWCISRQLWWGHRAPVYHCQIKNELKKSHDKQIWIAAHDLESAKIKASKHFSININDIKVVQDEDVLDTWFSSALLPFSVFGWPNQTEELKKYYPLSVMETGHDILFFWVARMVMLAKELTGQLPFDKILLHGIICDSQGKKMSKSLGNVISPESIIYGSTLKELKKSTEASLKAGVLSNEEYKNAIESHQKMFPKGIPECGADALRFTLASNNFKNHFINFDIQECYTNKLFCNKIWQATKYTLTWYNQNTLESIKEENITIMDRWILSRLNLMLHKVNDGLKNNDFYLATSAIKNFMYYEFCDIYLETTKSGLKNGGPKIAGGHLWTLITCLEVSLRTLAPFMPHISTHLHLRLPHFQEPKIHFPLPEKYFYRDETLENTISNVCDIVVGIRRLEKIFNITAKHLPEVHLLCETSVTNYTDFNSIICDLSNCHKVNIHSTEETIPKNECAIDTLSNKVTIFLLVPTELRKALALDLPKLETKKNKLLKDLDKINKMISGSTYKINATPENQQLHVKKIEQLQEKLDRVLYLEKLSR